MDKKIIIKGNSTIKKLVPDQYNDTRKESLNWDISGDILDAQKQVTIINNIYLNNITCEYKFIVNLIKKKLNSYKQQDIKNCIYGENFFISLDDTILKLVESKMICYYCKCKMFLLYTKIKDPKQWTLDRIDNSMGHNTNNVVVCCLECNLKRRNQNMEKFLFTKSLKLTKIE